MDSTVDHWMDDDVRFMEKYPNGIPIHELIPFYDAIANNEPLKLEWVSPGRVDPSEAAKPTTSSQEPTHTAHFSPVVSQTMSSKLAEFDFDEGSNQSFPSLASASVGSGTIPLNQSLRPIRHPPRQPRVANMDKILNDLFRSRKETNVAQHNCDAVQTSVPFSAVISTTQVTLTHSSSNALQSTLSNIPISTESTPSLHSDVTTTVHQPEQSVTSVDDIVIPCNEIKLDNNIENATITSNDVIEASTTQLHPQFAQSNIDL